MIKQRVDKDSKIRIVSMNVKEFEIDINSAVFKRVRENYSWEIYEVAKLLNVEASEIESWENGKKKPTNINLQKFATELKKSISIFLRPMPPKENHIPTDYRMLPEADGRLSKETMYSINKTFYLQEVSMKLRERLEITDDLKIRVSTIKDNPEEIANRERDNFGIKNIDQFKEWSGPYDAFRRWRSFLENKGILTFQFDFPLKEARGFSLTNKKPYVIVVNNKDVKEGQIFTLLHEYAHILLREEGICIPREKNKNNSGNAVESWCNKFAGALLMPKGVIYQELSMISGAKNWYKKVKTVANRYKVSKTAVLMRMLNLGIIMPENYRSYDRKSKVFEFEEIRKKKKNRGGAKQIESKIVKEKGKAFVSLVVKGIRHGVVSKRDSLNYLSANLKQLDYLTN